MSEEAPIAEPSTPGPATSPDASPRSRRSPRDQAFDAALGARIRTLRVAAGMNQTDFGRAIGVTFQQVQKYENGRNRVAVSTLQTIADALGVHPSVFFDGDLPEPSGPATDRRAALKAGAVLQRIRDPRVLKQLLAFAEALGEDEKPSC